MKGKGEMKRYRIYLAVSLGVNLILAVTMPYVVYGAFTERGYWAYGGEWLLPWLGAIITAAMLFWGGEKK